MASSLFGASPRPSYPQNNLFNMMQEFNKFKQSMAGKDPQAMVQELLRTGKMSQDQYQQLSQMANSLSGILK